MKSLNNLLMISGINWHHTLALVLIISIITLFLVLAVYSNILRDQVDNLTTFDTLALQRGLLQDASRPFSLARVQFAVWTVIISCSFVYFALCIGDCTSAPINETALVLMGIGATVTTVSTLIDKNDIQNNYNRHQNQPSEGFLIDILSDSNGISLHRFQAVVWTVIAMVVYLLKVYATKTGCDLPELSQTLLLLTGISNATYVVLKSNENAPATTGQPGAPAILPGQPPVNPPAIQPPPVVAPPTPTPTPASDTTQPPIIQPPSATPDNPA